MSKGVSAARTRLSPFRFALRANLHNDSRIITVLTVNILHSPTHCCEDRLRAGSTRHMTTPRRSLITACWPRSAPSATPLIVMMFGLPHSA
jgi:hypothetical protein